MIKILLLLITVMSIVCGNDTIWVDNDSIGGAYDGTTRVNAYSFLYLAEAENRTLTDTCVIMWFGGTKSDTVYTAFNGWDLTSYPLIIQVGDEDKHTGKWDDSKCRMSVDGNIAMLISDENIYFNGIQVELTNPTASYNVINVATVASPSHCKFTDCIIRTSTSQAYSGYGLRINDSDVDTCDLINTIVQHRGSKTSSDFCFRSYAKNLRIYYSNICGGYYSIRNSSTAVGTIEIKNTIGMCSSNGDYNMSEVGPTYDINYSTSQDGTVDDVGDGGHNVTLLDTTGVFVDISATNYHLNAAATALIGAGVTISGITTDIDGEPRGEPPDIGVDEYGSSCTPPTITHHDDITTYCHSVGGIKIEYTGSTPDSIHIIHSPDSLRVDGIDTMTYVARSALTSDSIVFAMHYSTCADTDTIAYEAIRDTLRIDSVSVFREGAYTKLNSGDTIYWADSLFRHLHSNGWDTIGGWNWTNYAIDSIYTGDSADVNAVTYSTGIASRVNDTTSINWTYFTVTDTMGGPDTLKTGGVVDSFYIAGAATTTYYTILPVASPDITTFTLSADSVESGNEMSCTVDSVPTGHNFVFWKSDDPAADTTGLSITHTMTSDFNDTAFFYRDPTVDSIADTRRSIWRRICKHWSRRKQITF